jgi:hypothetical protein
MEERVTRSEEDMRDVKSALSRLEPMIIRIDASLAATLPHLATKAEVADLRADMNQTILGVMIAAYGAGLAALSVIK